MELKDQVCSFLQSVKFLELGVESKGVYCYERSKTRLDEYYLVLSESGFMKSKYCEDFNHYTCYTVAELMEMLPAKIVKNGFDYRLKTKKTLIGYRVSYNVTRAITNSPHLGFSLKPPGENFAHVLADMLIYLLENKHINPEDLK